MKKTTMKYIKRGFQIILIGLILFFFTKQLVVNWDKLLRYEWRFNYNLAIFSTLILTSMLLVHCFNWHLILRKLGENIKVTQAIRIWCSSLATKYIPGAVWQYLTQIHLCKKEGIIKTKTITAQIIEFSMNVSSSLFVFVLSLFFWKGSKWGYKEMVILVGVIIGVVLFISSPFLKKVINLGLRIIKREPIEFKLKLLSTLLIFLLFVVLRIIQGIAFYIFVLSITNVSIKAIPFLIGVFSISWVAGYIVLIAPGGVGVREGVLAFFLNFFFPLHIAIVISLFSRIWMMTSEFIAILVGYSMRAQKE